MRKRIMVCSVLFLVVATCAAANPTKGPWGPLVPSPDPAEYWHYICDRTPGLLQIHIVYTRWYPATAVQFFAPKPNCFTGTYLTEMHPFPVTIGDSQHGVSVAFGSCLQPPVLILTMVYVAYGTTPADCVYSTLPDPGNPSGRVQMVDCYYGILDLTNGGNYINPPEANCEGPTPVESATWGKVKSLFSE